jgi:hypothetical protein
MRPHSAASPDCWWGQEGAIGQRATPPGDRHRQGRATKLAAAAATDYDMFLYHLFVCLFFALLINANTMHSVPTCDRFTFFILESIPLTGCISTDAEKSLPNIFFLMGQIIFFLWSFYGVLSDPQGQTIITKTKIGYG